MKSSYLQFLYRCYAPIYDLCLGRLFRDGHRKGIGCLPKREGLRVLEIGVGTGLSLAHYPDEIEVTGIDLSPAMLAMARRKAERNRARNLSLLEMDANKLAFPSGHFDAVLMFYTLSVVAAPSAVIAEAARVLKPDGDLIVVNHSASSNRVMGIIEKVISPVARVMGFRSDLPVEVCLADQSGIEILEIQPANLFGYWRVIHGRKQAIDAR